MTNSRVVTVEQVVLASGNAGKLREFQYLLAERGIDVVAQSEFDVPDAEETGLSFVENAILKARHAARLTGLPAIADDSGLEVDALDGAPGIYSARFAGPNASDADNNARLLELLKGVPTERRTARYQCCLVYMPHTADLPGQLGGRDRHQAQGQPRLWLRPAVFCAGAGLHRRRIAQGSEKHPEPPRPRHAPTVGQTRQAPGVGDAGTAAPVPVCAHPLVCAQMPLLRFQLP